MTTDTTAVPTRTGPSMARLVRIELRKAYDTRAGFWLLAGVVLSALAVTTLQLLYARDPARGFADYLATAQIPVSVLLPVVGILLVTSEWSQRTALSTFALVPDRSRVVLAKLAAAALLAVGGVLASLVAATATSLLTPLVDDRDVGWALPAAALGQMLLLQVLSVLVGAGFGMLLLSSPMAIVAYFVLPTAVTLLTGAVPALDWVRDWLDFENTTAPMYDGTLAGQGWARAATATALWLVVPVVAGWVRIRRGEIS